MTESTSISKAPLNSCDDTECLPIIPEAFSIHNASSANWLARKIIDARHYSTHIQTWAAAETRRAEMEERFFLQRFGSQLECWTRHQLLATQSRRRSIALPAGTVGFRSLAARPMIVDEAILLGWCAMHLPRAISVEVQAMGCEAARLRGWARQNCPSATITVSVVKSVLDEHFRQSGECPDGTECASGEKFFVK
jgi:hypothetical protein